MMDSRIHVGTTLEEAELIERWLVSTAEPALLTSCIVRSSAWLLTSIA